MEALIDCIGLGKYFGTNKIPDKEKSTQNTHFEALDNINFSLYPGDRLGIIGLNGAGKSTLLKIISGIIKPSKGRIEINGRVISVGDSTSLTHDDFTGLDNIKLQGKLLDIKSGDLNQKIANIIDYSELGDFIYQPLKNYSAGMRLRLSFSILMELRPEILLLDEALTAGDIIFKTKTEKSIRSFFSEIPGIIIVSHQLDEIASFCNKCMILDKGKMTFWGEMDEALDIYNRSNLKKSGIRSNDRITIHEIKLIKTTPNFYISEPIEISIKYTKHSDDGYIDPLIYLNHHTFPVLTDCPIYRSEFKRSKQDRGEYSFRLTIPAFLLNTGQYFLTFIFGDVETIVLELTNELEVNIIPDEWEKEKKWNLSPGFPIRSKLNWEMAYEKSE